VHDASSVAAGKGGGDGGVRSGMGIERIGRFAFIDRAPIFLT
jgi:hypothetical protein